MHLYLVSGHGGQTKDRDGDEQDGYDEGMHVRLLLPLPDYIPSRTVIYPVDFKSVGFIVDDVCAPSHFASTRLTCVY